MISSTDCREEYHPGLPGRSNAGVGVLFVVVKGGEIALPDLCARRPAPLRVRKAT
jgi:hypothetical protein